MVREIVTDTHFLSQKSTEATKADIQIARDLLDTLDHHSDICAGMAANMIGQSKRIIAVSLGIMNLIMFNPVITKTKDSYTATEGCLSLQGERSTTRYREIRVKYQDIDFKTHEQDFTGFTAHIIQHEVDHLNGILI